jgi:pyruvate/2-oxoglutarate dehydrogenase complex dihydrolipoamide dehydrogenase (E3) component
MARRFAIRNNGKDVGSRPAVDFAKVREYFQKNQQDIYDRDDSPEALEKFNVQTIHGRATLTSSQTLTVHKSDGNDDHDVSISAKQGIIVCTGATAKKPNVPGLDDGNINVVSYEDIWELSSLPERLTVVGGGPIGCELAQAMSRLGCRVTIIADRLLPREDPEASEILQQVFEEDENIRVVKGRLSRVSRNGSSGHVAYIDDGGTQKVQGDVMLISIGRTPSVSGLGLDDLGVTINERGGIAVNDKLETSVKGIYAAGDCTGDRQYTHYAGKSGKLVWIAVVFR